eukprot:364289-Chlamydomonas_euryale.AAC.3
MPTHVEYPHTSIRRLGANTGPNTSPPPSLPPLPHTRAPSPKLPRPNTHPLPSTLPPPTRTPVLHSFLLSSKHALPSSNTPPLLTHTHTHTCPTHACIRTTAQSTGPRQVPLNVAGAMPPTLLPAPLAPPPDAPPLPLRAWLRARRVGRACICARLTPAEAPALPAAPAAAAAAAGLVLELSFAEPFELSCELSSPPEVFALLAADPPFDGTAALPVPAGELVGVCGTRMRYEHEGSRSSTLMLNQGGVVCAQNSRRGRRSRPIMPAEAEAGPRPGTRMQ